MCGERPDVWLRTTTEGQLHPTHFLPSGSVLVRARSGESLHFPIVWWGHMMRPCGTHSWNKGSLTQSGQRISGQNSTVVLPYLFGFNEIKRLYLMYFANVSVPKRTVGKEEAGLRGNMKSGRISSFWSQSSRGGWDPTMNPPRSCVFRKEVQGRKIKRWIYASFKAIKIKPVKLSHDSCTETILRIFCH